MVVRVLLRAQVVQGVAAARLPVTRDLALLNTEPVDILRTSGETSAANVSDAVEGVDDVGIRGSTLTVLLEGSHVEKLNALELGKSLQTVDTGGNLERSRLGTLLSGTRTEESVGASGLLKVTRDLGVGEALLGLSATQNSARGDGAASSQTRGRAAENSSGKHVLTIGVGS